MDTLIYNIDSKDRNTTNYPNSHNFTYNKVDSVIDGVTRIDPFNIKNVIEINVSNIEIPNTFHFINNTKVNNKVLIGTINPPTSEYTLNNGSYTKVELVTALSSLVSGIDFTYSSTTGLITITNTTGNTYYLMFESNNTVYPSLGNILGLTNDTVITITNGASVSASIAMTLPQEPYVFLQISDLGNIIHREQRYVAKLVPDNSTRFDDLNRETIYKTLSTNIRFNQPRDINKLDIKLIDNFGNLTSINNANFSFTFEIKTINNSILKQYEEISFYNNDVMERILHAQMLEYYKRMNNNPNINLTTGYNMNTQNQFNKSEFNYDGNRNNYNYSHNPFIPK
jgi:hypothetical protein